MERVGHFSIPNYTPEEITQLYRVMTPSEKKEFDELISGGRSAETLTLEAAGPETWLRTLGSRTFTGTLRTSITTSGNGIGALPGNAERKYL